MSVSYVAVQWNAHKKVYDLAAVGGVVLFLAVFVGVSVVARGERAPSIEVLVLRGLGACAISLLHVVLMIGPLARLDRRMGALLYNRRHLGVLTFVVALAHAALATMYYGFFGDRNPIIVMLATNTAFDSVRGFPFEVLGLGALCVLFVMAATSHDFWLKNLGPVAWKWLHMSVYGAYVALVGHVLLGTLQSEATVVPALLLGAGGAVLGALHIAAGVRSTRELREQTREGEWLDACGVDELVDCRAKIVRAGDARSIAVFRYDGKVSAVSNTCVHQGGPLGEGKIVGGCITCPWHGYQYLPDCGRSPPPFTEKIPTYEVRISAGRVLVNSRALPPGTDVEPARIVGEERAS